MEITTSVFFHHACGASPAAPASSTMKKKQSCFRPAATTRMDIGRAKAKRLSSTARSVMARPHEAVAVALPPLPLPLPPAPREAVVAPLPLPLPLPPPPPARDQSSPTEAATTSTTTTVYQDNWFDKVAIGYLSRKLQEVSGLKNGRDGYEGLIEAALTIAAIFKVEKQWEIVSDALQQAIPSYILTMIKVMMPPSRFSRQYFAAFTTIFFPWLVGPCEVIESEVDGKKEKNVVYVPKCRFLESTNCVGMCTNLCKIPSEKFIKDAFGMPVYMSPNFEDMSCQMIFGQEPPEDDPTLKQPCFATKCIAKQKHRLNCSS